LWVEVEINILPIITFKNKGSIVIFIGIDGNFCYQNRELTQSESVLAVTKTHSKNAKKYEEEAKVSAETAKKLANPEVKLTKKTEPHKKHEQPAKQLLLKSLVLAIKLFVNRCRNALYFLYAKRRFEKTPGPIAITD
jgi:hypothetical protein